MTVFLTTVVLFVAAIFLHLLVWKIRLPKFHTRTLLILFAIVAGVWLATLPLRPVAWPEALHVLLFYTSLSLCYVITYSAIEGDSPTLSLVRHLDQDVAQGMSSDEVHRFLQARPFVKARLNALIHDGLVREEGGRYCVAGSGSLFFQVILLFRRLYGSIERGG